MAEVLSAQPGTEMDLLEQQGSADAAAEVSIPDATADKQLEEPVRQQLGMYFVRVPRPALDDTSHTINKLETELSACFTKLKAINNKFQVKKVMLGPARSTLIATTQQQFHQQISCVQQRLLEQS
jgi:hypothetical protein